MVSVNQDYIFAQLAELGKQLDTVDIPTVSWTEYVRCQKDFLGGLVDVNTRLYGKDFVGIRVNTGYGPVVAGFKRDGEYCHLVISASPAAENHYDLTEYRWGTRPINELFSALVGCSMPAGHYEFMGTIQSLSIQ